MSRRGRGRGEPGGFPHQCSSARSAEANLKEEGGPWGKHGFPHGSEPKASDTGIILEVVREIADLTEAAAVPAVSRS
jgi:hypothetical protein